MKIKQKRSRTSEIERKLSARYNIQAAVHLVVNVTILTYLACDKHFIFAGLVTVYLFVSLFRFVYFERIRTRYNAFLRNKFTFLSSYTATENYKLLFDNMTSGASIQEVIKDKNGEIVDFRMVAVNKSYERHTGLMAVDILGKTILEIFPKTSPEMIAKYGNVASTGEPFEMEYYSAIFRKYLRVSVYSPCPGRFVSLFEDISEQKKQQEQLFNLSSAVEQSSNVIVITDTEGTIEYVNQAFTKLNGYSHKEAVGKNPKILNAGILPADHYKGLWDCLKSGSVWEGEFCNKNKFGEIYWEKATISLLRDKDGKVVRYLAIKEDISKQKLLEKEREEKEAKYRELFEGALDAIFLADMATESVVDCNRAASDLLKKTKKDIVGRNISSIFPPEALLLTRNPEQKLWSLDGLIESEITTAKGNIRDVAVKVNVFQSGGQMLIQGIFRDITSHKKAEKELMSSYLQMEQMNSTKDKFFNIIAHDLKNPLAGLKALTNQLRHTYREITTDHATLYIRMIDEAANQAYILTEDLLTWSRLQNNSFRANPQIVELFDSTELIVAELSNFSTGKNIKVINETDEDHLIFADPNMVKAILRNLLSNAIKFTPVNGEVKITSFDDDHIVSVSVTDNGVGISEKIQEKLFRIDVSYSSEGTEREKGTGLGLILCKEFAEKNNGTISLHSEFGKGSTFTFCLPKYYGQEIEED